MINYILLMIFHIIGDFYLQTDKVAKCKNAQVRHECGRCKQTKKCTEEMSFNIRYVAVHSLIYAVPFGALFFMTNIVTALVLVAAIIVSHMVIDIASCCINKISKKTLVFLADQAVHTGVLFCMFRSVSFNMDFSQYMVPVKVTFIVLLLISPCSILIKTIMKDIFSDEVDTGIFDVGSIIGILERLLVAVFAYLGDLAVIAVIITVKTWARSNDLQKEGFSNKYLLGTLASLVLAALVFLLYKLI